MPAEASTLKRILIATDLSDVADRAIKRGVQLAGQRGAEIDIVHIIDEDVPEAARAELETTHGQLIRDRLEGMDGAGQVKTTISIVFGRAKTDLVEQAKVFGADLIVLSLHTRLLEENQAIEGTLAESVIRESHLPVLLVKDIPNGAYRSVVVGVDYSLFSLAAVRTAAVVAPQARLALVHAYEGEAEAASQEEQCDLENFLSGLQSMPPVAMERVVKAGEARVVLEKEIAERRADLAVVGTHGRSGLSRALFGSVATDVINERLCDVLVTCSD